MEQIDVFSVRFIICIQIKIETLHTTYILLDLVI